MDQNDDVWFRAPEPLGLPLGLTAAVMALFAVDFSRTLQTGAHMVCLYDLARLLRLPRIGWGPRLLLAAAAFGMFAVAGRAAARRVSQGSPPLRTVLLWHFGAGAVLASLVGLVTLGRDFSIGLVLGLMAALASAPFALLLARSAAWAWRAREGTLLHRAYRQARWIDFATAVTVLLAAYANPAFGAYRETDVRMGVAQTLVLVATGVAIIMATYALVSVLRVSQIGARFAAAGGGEDGAQHATEAGAEVVDLGLGEQRARDVERAKSAYRDQARVNAICVGDLRRARRVVFTAVARSVVVAAAGVVVLVADLDFVGAITLDQCWA